MESLKRLAAGLREPKDYFAGTGGHPWCWPRNLLAFVRWTRRDLQRHSFESRLHTRYVLVVNLHTAAATDFQGEVLVGDSLTLQLVIFHNQYLEGRRGNAS